MKRKDIDIDGLKYILSFNYELSQELKHFNEYDMSLVEEIVAHNNLCKNDLSKTNNVDFWEDIINRSYNSEAVFGAIVSSPYAPESIVKKIAKEAEHPKVLLEILKKNIILDNKIYDRIQQKSKTNICNILKEQYDKQPPAPLPFNQHAINYYARKAYLIQQFTDYPTLWNVYEKINIYGNELVDVYNKIRDLSAEKNIGFYR